MKAALKIVSAAALVGAGLAAGSAFSAETPSSHNIVMTPGKGLSMDVGGKHTMSYFEPKEEMCNLTIVVAAVEGGMSGNDTPGTRINVQVTPGKALRLDSAQAKSAEFMCGPNGAKMSARLFDREAYKGAKS